MIKYLLLLSLLFTSCSKKVNNIHVIKIGDCFSSPFSYVLEKTKDGYKNLYYGKTYAQTEFKVVDIREKNNRKYYILQFFKQDKMGQELEKDLIILGNFEKYKQVIEQFSDWEHKVCNELDKTESKNIIYR